MAKLFSWRWLVASCCGGVGGASITPPPVQARNAGVCRGSSVDGRPAFCRWRRTCTRRCRRQRARARRRRAIASKMLAEQPTKLHVRPLRRNVRLPGAACRGAMVEGAADALVEADWLRPPAASGKDSGGAGESPIPHQSPAMGKRQNETLRRRPSPRYWKALTAYRRSRHSGNPAAMVSQYQLMSQQPPRLKFPSSPASSRCDAMIIIWGDMKAETEGAP